MKIFEMQSLGLLTTLYIHVQPYTRRDVYYNNDLPVRDGDVYR